MDMSLDHVSLTVSDVDRSVEFYTKAFGFRRTRRSQSDGPLLDTILGYPNAKIEIAWVALGSLNVEFIQYVQPHSEHRPVLHTKDVGTPHLAFRVQDIRAEHQRLLGLGARFKSEPVQAPGGTHFSVYAVDPDGITFELVQRDKPPL